jgi:hypothetical protein
MDEKGKPVRARARMTAEQAKGQSVQKSAQRTPTAVPSHDGELTEDQARALMRFKKGLEAWSQFRRKGKWTHTGNVRMRLLCLST